jgi:Domain of unknown function (DUF4160)
MPELCRPCTNHRVRLCMYPDHVPPHFNLRGPGWSANVAIATLTVIRGWAPRKELEEAVQWASQNIEFLYAEWERLNERG